MPPLVDVARPLYGEDRVVVTPDGKPLSADTLTEAASNHGTLVDSGTFSGLTSDEALRKMTAFAREKEFGEGKIDA